MRKKGYLTKRAAAGAIMAVCLAGSVCAVRADELLVEEVYTEAAAEPVELYVEEDAQNSNAGGAQGDVRNSEEDGAQGDSMDLVEIPTDELITEVTVEEAVPAVQTEIMTEAQTDAQDGEGVELKGLHFASDYKEVYDALCRVDYKQYYTIEDDIDIAMEESAVASVEDSGAINGIAAPVTAETNAAAEAAGLGYSDTNVREQGVDEADVVKTDGQYLYMLYDENKLTIVKADAQDSQLVSETQVGAADSKHYGSAREMYVDGDLLTVIFEMYSYWYDSAQPQEEGVFAPEQEYTAAYTYDISDRANPVLAGSTWQDGYYSQSRKIGDHIYLYTYQYPRLMDTYEKSDIIPVVNGKQVNAADVCIPDHLSEASYLIVSSYDQKDPGNTIDRKVLVSGSGNMYVSAGNLYAMTIDYNSSPYRTEIVKFSCREGKISGVGACRIKGRVKDSFCIDEYKGNLRVLTTYTGSETGAFLSALADLFGVYYDDPDQWVNHNALFILDENLNLRARLAGIARNEEIRSARYFGDTAYFVTFRQTDPLFSADLSDPDAPKLTGELKVTGFSSYLHPFGEGLLLGFGYEADPDTGITSGLKLSMFDIHDPSAVEEIDRYVIKGITWCEALDDYKTIFARPEKGLARFFCDDRYMLFSYDRENGFGKVLHYDFYEDGLGAQADCRTTRGVYIGDEFYLAGGSFLVGFDMLNGFGKNLLLDLEQQ